MRRLFLMILFVGLIAPTGLHAQKVYKEGDKVILDMTVGAGMPEGSVTSQSKTTFYDGFSASSSSEANNGVNHSLNATVYQKLEISLEGPSNSQNWTVAMNYCKNLNQADNSDWRLPTQRELILIFIFMPALEPLGVTAFNSWYHWSATDKLAVRFSDGETISLPNGNTFWVRCVREVQ